MKIKNEKDNYYTNVLSKPIKVAEEILILINDEITREKINLFRFQGTTQKEIAEPEPKPFTTNNNEVIDESRDSEN